MIKLKQLSQLIASVCKLPRVSKKLLQAVTGRLAHPFMHRRSLMCILQDTFLWIERLKDGDSKPLPTSVREELLCSGLMLPLCHSNAKWEVSCRIGASDASLSHGGRAATIVSQPIAHSLYRYAEHKGEHIRLDWEKGQVQVDSEMRRAPRELEDLIGDLPWNQTETCSFAHKQHINILETKMIQHELKDVVGKTTKALRCVLLVDSRAAAGAWAKGRSSARNLNRLLRQSLGWLIAGRKSLHIVWVRSEANPADHPSRCKKIPPPRDTPSQTSNVAFGDSLDQFRTRRANRDIWRSVCKPADFPKRAHNLDAQLDFEPTTPASSEKLSQVGWSGTSSPSDHPAACKWIFKEIF